MLAMCEELPGILQANFHIIGGILLPATAACISVQSGLVFQNERKKKNSQKETNYYCCLFCILCDI